MLSQFSISLFPCLKLIQKKAILIQWTWCKYPKLSLSAGLFLKPLNQLGRLLTPSWICTYLGILMQAKQHPFKEGQLILKKTGYFYRNFSKSMLIPFFSHFKPPKYMKKKICCFQKYWWHTDNGQIDRLLWNQMSSCWVGTQKPSWLILLTTCTSTYKDLQNFPRYN